MTESVVLGVTDGIATVTLSRPERRNAFDQPLRERLAECLEAVAGDPTVRGIVVTGAGGHFSAGGDIEGFRGASVDDMRQWLKAAHRCIRAIRQAAKPVVAAVEGTASGGAMGLLLACDAVAVSGAARLGFPFLRLGLVPDWGVVPLLRARVGDGVARRLLLQPQVLSGQEAVDLGVADSLTGEGQSLDRALDMVKAFSAFPSQAWSRTKAMLNLPVVPLEDSLAVELEQQALCFGSEDFRQAIARFLDKGGAGGGFNQRNS